MRNISRAQLIRAGIQALALLFAIQVYGVVGNHSVLAWLFVPLVLLCQFRVTVLTLGFAAMLFVGDFVGWASAAADTALAAQAALLAIWAWHGTLLRHPSTTIGVRLRLAWRQAAVPFLFVLAAALVCSLGLRTTPIVPCLLWAVCVLSIACAVPTRTPLRWQSVSGSAILAAASIAVSLLLIEFGVRLLLPATTPPVLVTVYDPDAWWTLGANASGEFEFPDNPLGTPRTVARFAVRTSSQGFRDRAFGPKKPGEYRILLLGDSFVYGWGVNEDDMISRRLEAHLNAAGGARTYTVINDGVEGYGPWQERIRLNKQGFSLQPDLVVLQVFPANDIDNSLAKVGKHMAAYSPQWQQTFRGRRYWGVWQVRAQEWAIRHSAVYNALVRATGNAKLMVDVLDRIRFLPPSGLDALVPTADRPYWIEVQLKDWYPDLREGLAIMESDMLAMRDDCRARGVEFVAFTVPDINSVCDSSWEWNMGQVKDPSIYVRGTDVRTMREFFDREGIASIDLPAAIASEPDPCALYYGNDGHLTPTGTEIAARAIAQYVVKRGGLAGEPASHS